MGEVLIWQQYYNNLVCAGDYWTFSELAELQNYSFKGRLIDFAPTIVNYAGTPWEMMKQNNIAFNYLAKKFVNKLMIVSALKYDDGLVKNSPILPQAYSIDGLNRMHSFTGFWDKNFNVFKIERFFYESILG